MKVWVSIVFYNVWLAHVASGWVAVPSTSSATRVRLNSILQATTTAPSVVEEEEEESSAVDFPPPLTPIQRATRAVEFYKRALPVLAAYKAKEVEFAVREKLGLPVDSEEEIWKELDEWGSQRISETIQEMKGFYVKTGQVISTRVDLFPEAYTSKLQQLQDGIEPMPFDMVKKVVEQELLDGAPLSELFATFDETPLGSASIAQVHKATLLDGRTVAVKLQRPNVEPKLRGDIANLKRISKALADSLPVDYYTVFCELGDALENELDFLAEAQAMRKIDLAISHQSDGTSSDKRPVTIPLPVGELVTKRVLVMDFVEGVPLNRLRETMKERGIEPGSPESKLAGRRILDSLAVAFGRMIFGAGFIHGDPHPGNIFIGKGGKVSLIDCGQFKSLSRDRRLQMAELVLAVGDYQDRLGSGEGMFGAKRRLANCVRKFGIQCIDGREEDDDDLACAIALVLFSDSGVELPGGYSSNELSEDSPIRLLTSFPQELVLLGRATVLLKGIAKRLGVTLSLVDRWREDCRSTIVAAKEPQLPLWGREKVMAQQGDIVSTGTENTSARDGKVRFAHVTGVLQQWAKGKGTRFAQRMIEKLPPEWKNRVLEYVLAREERKDAKKKKDLS